MELAGALFWYWTKCGLFEEGTRWLELAVGSAADVPKLVRARALIGLANLHWFQGRHVDVDARAAEALLLGRDLGDDWVVPFALFLQGTAAFERGDHEQAEVRSREALHAADLSGDDVLHGPPLLVLGNVAVSKGDLAGAQQLYDQSIVAAPQKCLALFQTSAVGHRGEQEGETGPPAGCSPSPASISAHVRNDVRLKLSAFRYPLRAATAETTSQSSSLHR